MSQRKKMDEQYRIGFNDACDFWDLALKSTKGIGPKKHKAIMDRVRELTRNAEQKGASENE